ncbi:MAG: alpha/beta hydrolase [Phenylobacterium sp.]
MKAYNGSEFWARYRGLVLSGFGIEIGPDPIERVEALCGHEVHIDDWAPAGDPLGVVILVHGAGGNGRILAPLASQIRQAGWRVLAPDLPGYGLTPAAQEEGWDYRPWPEIIAALAASGGRKVVLVGASVGGSVALQAASRSGNVAGDVVTTLLDMSDIRTFTGAARWPWLAQAALAGFRLVPGLVDGIALPLGWLAPMKSMTSDPRLRNLFERHPLLGGKRVPARFFRTLHEAGAVRRQLPCPLLLAHPEADAWTPLQLSLAVYDRLEGRKRLLVLANGSHLPLESPGAGQLLAAVLGFLEEILGQSLGGRECA